MRVVVEVEIERQEGGGKMVRELYTHAQATIHSLTQLGETRPGPIMKDSHL
jgi:hypothetical protein